MCACFSNPCMQIPYAMIPLTNPLIIHRPIQVLFCDSVVQCSLKHMTPAASLR